MLSRPCGRDHRHPRASRRPARVAAAGTRSTPCSMLAPRSPCTSLSRRGRVRRRAAPLRAQRGQLPLAHRACAGRARLLRAPGTRGSRPTRDARVDLEFLLRRLRPRSPGVLAVFAPGHGARRGPYRVRRDRDGRRFGSSWRTAARAACSAVARNLAALGRRARARLPARWRDRVRLAGPRISWSCC